MGPRSSSFNRSYQEMIEQFELLQENQNEGIRYLQHKQTKKQYLLKEITCHDKDAFSKIRESLESKQESLGNNRHVASLVKIIANSEDQFCMTFYKLYALFEFPQRTLEDEINERALQKRKFQEKQLWSILASSILGLSHLKKSKIKHTSLRSNTILISFDGIIKVYDPIATGCPSNYDTLLSQRSTPHLYLSPQQVEGLREQKSSLSYEPFKSDIWTMGMIILEAGLLSYQDECYRDQCSRIHWQTLQYNINLFQQAYSPDLTNLVEFMLSRDERSRPDWSELEEHVIKVEEDVRGSGVAPQSYRKQLQPSIKGENLPDRSFLVDKTMSESMPLDLNTSNTKNQSSKVGIARLRAQPRSSVAIPIKISDISFTRPIRSIFPVNFYANNSKPDENMILVPQEEPAIHQNKQVEPVFHPSANASLYNNLHLSPIQASSLPVSSNFSQPAQYFTSASPYQNSFPTPSSSIQLESSPKLKAEGVYVTQQYKQGSKYEGCKLNGEKHGFGKFYYQDGGLYEGEWRHGKMQGIGKLYYQSNRLAYHGEWHHDQFSGKGTLYNQLPEQFAGTFDYRNFDDIQEFWVKYEGDFYDDMKHGWGILYLSNGQRYQGEFKNDFADGSGTFLTKQGLQIRGRWHCNVMQ